MAIHSIVLSRAVAECRTKATTRNPLKREKKENKAPRKAQEFIRYKEYDRDYSALETASVRYERENINVDLVGAVHIGEAEYYGEMSRRLDEYDIVLYELVKKDSDTPRILTDCYDDDDSTRAPPRPAHPVTLIQTSLSRLMGFSFQLDSIDHNKKNWINADIDLETFQKLQAERGESIYGFSLKLGWLVVKEILSDAVRFDRSKTNSTISARIREKGWVCMSYRDVQSKIAELFGLLPIPIVAMLASEGLYWASRGQARPWFENLATSPEMKAILQLDISACTKAMLARQLSFNIMFTSPGPLKALSESVIVGERNKIAMNCLDKAIRRCQRADSADGTGKTVRIAMVYGAAHLPDLEQRLFERSFARKEASWHSAWTIESSGDKKISFPFEIPDFDKVPLPGGSYVVRKPDRNILKGCAALAGLSLILGTDLALWESFYEYLLNLPSRLFHVH